MNNRRRLLSALASSPVVFTLGAARGQALSSATCQDRPESYDEQGRLNASCLTSLGVESTESLING